MVAAAAAPRRCGRGSASVRLRLRGVGGPPAAPGGGGGRTPGAAAAAAGHRETLAGDLSVSVGTATRGDWTDCKAEGFD